MINAIDNVVNAISGVLYKPYIVPLLLVLAGIVFTAIAYVCGWAQYMAVAQVGPLESLLVTVAAGYL